MTATEAAPLAAVARWMDSVSPARVGIAVSGGGDSVALLHLAHCAAPGRVAAVTVDHGLRAASADEARQMAEYCADLGVPHRVLCWSGPADSGNLMAQARQARFALIASWAQEQGLGCVALGHTLDDQAESFLMNLGRAAGLDGLSGMRADWQAAGVRWCRPLLAIARADLRAYLRGQGISWIDDPTNEDDRFARVRARRAVAALRPVADLQAIGRSIAHLAALRADLTRALGAWVAAHVTEQAGALTFDRVAWAALLPDLRRRLIPAILRWMTGAEHPPREAQLARLIDALLAGQGGTLGGVRFRLKGNHISVMREPRAVVGLSAPCHAGGGRWDGRWRLTGPAAKGEEIRALGAQGLALCPDWRTMGNPREALIVSPAIWDGGRLVAAPLAGKSGGWVAEPDPSFGMFILSH